MNKQTPALAASLYVVWCDRGPQCPSSQGLVKAQSVADVARLLSVVVSSQRGMKIRGAKAVVWYSAIRLAISAAVSNYPREGNEK